MHVLSQMNPTDTFLYSADTRQLASENNITYYNKNIRCYYYYFPAFVSFLKFYLTLYNKVVTICIT
jgi:hypothetical protein